MAKPSCLGPCFYFGFFGLKRVCRHPEHARLLATGKERCEFGHFTPEDIKPGPKVKRLTFDELASVLEEKNDAT